MNVTRNILTGSPKSAAAPPALPDWVNRRGRIYWYDQYAMNEQATAFRAYDPDRIARELLATGAEIIVIYAANQYGIAYYPSAIWPQHPNLKGRDYVGDLVTRLRARGRKIVLYINWLDSKHIEWHSRPPGLPPPKEHPLVKWAHPAQPKLRVQAVPGGHWQTPCLASPHRADVIAVAKEIAERYRPDGFHLDMYFNGGICACRYCRPALEKICGTSKLTAEVVLAHWREFIDWRSSVSGALFAELTAMLREHGVLAMHNAFAPLYMPAGFGIAEEWLPSLDVFISECFDAFQAPATDLNSTSINVRWQHAVGKPSWILRTSTLGHYAHWPISQAQWQIYAAACKANGAKVFGPCGVGAYPDTTSSKALLENATEGMAFFMKDADLDAGAESAAKIALLFSWATRKYYEADAGAHQWADELTGWARLLIEEHWPFDIVEAEHLTREQLAKYDLVILPNTSHLADATCRLLRAYVRGGGRLLATAESSQWNEKGGKRKDFALGDVLGIKRQGARDGHFAISGHREPEPASGLAQLVKTNGQALAFIVEVDPAGSVSHGKDPLPLQPTSHPVFVRHAFGKGRTVYAAFAIGRYFTMHGDQHIGIWMNELLQTLLPKRQIEVRAPRTVEVTVWRQPAVPRTIIHLANRSVPWSLPTNAREITEILPVPEVELTLASPYARPKVTGRGVTVRAKRQRGRLVLRVPVLNAYAAVVIEPGAKGVAK